MSRVKLILLSLLAVVALSAVASASASAATCYQVAVAGTGNMDGTANCTTNVGPTANNYILATALAKQLKKGEWCAEVAAGTGQFKDNLCTSAVAPKNFVKVLVPEYEFYRCKKVAAGTGRYTTKECKTTGAPEEWEWKNFAAGETAVASGTSGVSKLESELGGLKTVIECGEDEFSGEVEPAGANKGKVTFKLCKLYEVKTTGSTAPLNRTKVELCTVPNITFNFTSKLVRGQGLGPAPGGPEWGPELEFNGTLANEVFVEVELGAGCPGLLKEAKEPAKQHEVEVREGVTSVHYKGQVCSLPEAAVGKLEHEIVCTSSGSHLTFAGKPAYFFSTDKVHLAGMEFWAAE